MGILSRRSLIIILFSVAIIMSLFIVLFRSRTYIAQDKGEPESQTEQIAEVLPEDYETSEKINVLFFNPGAEEDIGVWHLVSKFMKAAADDLSINLEILYADRNHLRMYEQVEQVILRNYSPDYIIIVNEKQLGERMLSALQKINSKVIVIHNDITPEQRERIGNEREKLSNWIGTIVTDEYEAGYREIAQLYQCVDDEPRVIAITGDISTPVSKVRENGLRDFIAESGQGELFQVVYGNWSYADGRDKTLGLLERYDGVNIIWTANDSMGLGAYSAVVEKNLEDKVAVGGLGGFPDSLSSISENGMKVTVGGHSMIGAWALIMIYDFDNNRDFDDDIGLSYKVNHLSVIDSGEKAAQFKDLVLDNPDQIDFTVFSKTLNSKIEAYDFTFDQVVKASFQ